MSKRMFGQYATYNFTDKDPCIDALRTIIADEKLTYKQIHEITGVSVSTLWHWFEGDTKRPQHATYMAVLRGAGWDYELVRMTKKLKRVA